MAAEERKRNKQQCCTDHGWAGHSSKRARDQQCTHTQSQPKGTGPEDASTVNNNSRGDLDTSKVIKGRRHHHQLKPNQALAIIGGKGEPRNWIDVEGRV